MTGYHLLYIDDDRALGRYIQRHFQRLGYQVDLATSGDEGLARLATQTFHAVALDHYMPTQDGLETLRRIRELPDPPPVIFVTGTNESRIAVDSLKAGAADYVVKDIGGEFVELLEASFRSAIAAVKLRREKETADREIRAARDRFEALAAEREVLLREVNHRVGNSLQLVAAFLHMQASTSPSPETRAALGEANRRVLAIAQIHRRLYAADDVAAVALAAYLRGLVEDIRASTDAEDFGDFLTLDADEVMVDPDSAVCIGIIVTELVINAMKYAYPDGHGPIRITLHRVGADAWQLAVEDDGVGMRGTAPGAGQAGIGNTIIDAMAAKLATQVHYEPLSPDAPAMPGTRAAMVFSLPMPTTAAAPRPRGETGALSAP